jgi:NitT/TauT family transport system permease protein
MIFAVAFGVAAAAGIVFGGLMGLSRTLYDVLHPIVTTLFAAPKMIFIPIILLVLGFGTSANLVYSAISGFFPIAITVTAGVRAVDNRLLLASRSLGATGRQQFRAVVLPASAPAVVTALWFGVKHTLLGVLIMELFASQKGVGYFISKWAAARQTDKVFAMILLITIFASALGVLISLVGRRVDRWRTV